VPGGGRNPSRPRIGQLQVRRNIPDRFAAATADIAGIGPDGGPRSRRRHRRDGGDRAWRRRDGRGHIGDGESVPAACRRWPQSVAARRLDRYRL
jgi:hypothetical protein